MRDRVHISLRGSGKTTRIINKAVDLINEDNPTKVIILVNTYEQRQYMIREISDALNNDEKMVKYLDIMTLLPKGIDDCYEKLLVYCEREDAKVLVDTDIPSVIKRLITKGAIVKHIELIEVPLETLII